MSSLGDFLEKVRKRAAKQPGGQLVNVSIAAAVLADKDPDAFVSGLKLLAVMHGKPVVRATLVSLVEAALED